MNVDEFTNSLVLKYLTDVAPDTAKELSKLCTVGKVTQTLEEVVARFKDPRAEKDCLKIEDFANSVLLKYRTEAAPAASREFSQEFRVGEVIKDQYEGCKAKDDGCLSENFTNSLVLKYMTKAAPDTAREFSKNMMVEEIYNDLEEIVAAYPYHNLKEVARKIIKRRKFTQGEDKIIYEFLEESPENIDLEGLANELGRTKTSVEMRIYRLKNNVQYKGGKSVSDIERQSIVDMILEKRFVGSRLSDSKQVSVEDWKRLSSELGTGTRPWNYLKYHWMTWMKPCLLQHLSGTRGLDIDKMLVSHVSDTYGDNDVDWDKVVQRQEFAGHTNKSLQQVFNNFKAFVASQSGLNREEVKIADILKYVCGKKKKSNKIKETSQSNLIEYFQNRVNSLRAKDFYC